MDYIPVALQLMISLCYLIPLHEPPLLALQIGREKTLDVLSVMAIAWTLDKVYTSLLPHGGSGRAMSMYVPSRSFPVCPCDGGAVGG